MPVQIRAQLSHVGCPLLGDELYTALHQQRQAAAAAAAGQQQQPVGATNEAGASGTAEVLWCK